MGSFKNSKRSDNKCCTVMLQVVSNVGLMHKLAEYRIDYDGWLWFWLILKQKTMFNWAKVTQSAYSNYSIGLTLSDDGNNGINHFLNTVTIVTKLLRTLIEDENFHPSRFFWRLKMKVMTFLNGCHWYSWPLYDKFKYVSWILMA